MNALMQKTFPPNRRPEDQAARIGFRPVMWLFLAVLFCLPAFAQDNIRIKGKITDEAGQPVARATISVKGQAAGANANDKGEFEIMAPSNGTLVISAINFTQQEVAINNRQMMSIALVSNAKIENEVIVIGYGTQRKEAVTGSVASISGNKMRDVPSPNVSRSLQGRVAGVEMAQTSSKPGSAMQIRIRGTRSLNASNDPLIVLDGIPFAGSIEDIDPNSIETVDILKDASATAIYGSRGANGVLLVTSKKGKTGQRPRVSYNGFHGLVTLFSRFPMMNGPEYVALRKAAGKFRNTIDEADSVNTDWQDLLYKTGMMTSHDVGVVGGSDKSTYSFGLGYYREEGVIPLQHFDRYSMRAAIDQRIGNYVRLGLNTNNNYSVNNGSSLGPGNGLARSPIANLYNPDGSLKRIIQENTSGAQWVYTQETLEALGDKFVNLNKVYGSYNTLFGEVQIPGVQGLKYRANLGLSFRQTNDGSYTGEGVFSGNPTTPSTASIGNSLTTNWAIENLLTYDRTFGGKHAINAVALYSAQENRFNSSSVSARDIPSDKFQFYNLGQATGEITVNPANQAYNTSGLVSYMGRVMYSYDDRYMLSATFRSDASSRLAKGHKWHSYPAISAGWNIHKESFMQNVTPLDMLKLRVGYGETSNQSIDPYKTLGLLSSRPYNFGPGTYDVGYYLNEIPNPNLGWEYSRTWNFGLDFSLLKRRLTGTIEYYVTNTEDVLLSINMPATSGVTRYWGNIGSTQNRGIEFTLNGTILENVNGFTWDMGVNLYANRNKLVQLASGQTEDRNNWWFVGHPIDVIYDYEKEGLWQDHDSYRNVLEPDGNVGMIKVKYTGGYDANGVPLRKIDATDMQIIDINPKFQGGFNTRLAYKGFDLNIVGLFKSGGILNSTLYGSAGYLNNMSTRTGGNVKVDFWTPENPNAKYPKPGGVGGDNPRYGSTLGYFDASYLKIRTITLGYNLSDKLVKKAGIQNFRVYATVTNPFVMFSPYHKESGMDPETNSFGNENAAVPYSANLKRLLTIGTNSPSTRNFLLGVNLTF